MVDVFMIGARSHDHLPYNSWGNGSAMRVSPVAYIYPNDLQKTLDLAEISAQVTHDHAEGIKGAQATAAATWLAQKGKSKDEIKAYIEKEFNYDLERGLEALRVDYQWDVSCQKTVPESIICFLEAKDFEDCIRNAISLGGDADTMACIAGGIAEAYYGIPEEIKEKVLAYLDERILKIYTAFSLEYGF